MNCARQEFETYMKMYLFVRKSTHIFEDLSTRVDFLILPFIKPQGTWGPETPHTLCVNCDPLVLLLIYSSGGPATE